MPQEVESLEIRINESSSGVKQVEYRHSDNMLENPTYVSMKKYSELSAQDKAIYDAFVAMVDRTI